MEGKFIKLPLDFQSWHEFRMLAAKMGLSRATFIYVMLWRELAYQVDVTRQLGFLRAEMWDLFHAPISEVLSSNVTLHPNGGVTPGTAFLTPTFLVEVGILTVCEGGWMCSRFARLNEHLSPDYKPMHMKGAAASKLTRQLRKEEQHGMATAMLFSPESWKLPDGRAMTSDEIKQVRLVVIGLDGALGIEDRPNVGGWPEGLTHDAWRVTQKYKPEERELILRWVLHHATHPAIPKTTEQLLERFDEVVAAFRKAA